MAKKPKRSNQQANKGAKPSALRAGSPGQLRIIGGLWRSRRLPIASVPGLRPTPDRVRETLFNWLQFEVPGGRCLDLFAGSGALGLEALSREAAEVVFVEKHPRAFAGLQASIDVLQTDGAQLVHHDALAYLQARPEPFDLIFLDPPFRKGLLVEVLDKLAELSLLKPDGLLYVEYESELAPDFPQWGLSIHRETSAGQVVSALLRANA